jgi:ABC-type sulfate transport system permease subunit
LAPVLLGTWFVLFFGLAGYFLEYYRLYLVGVMYALPEIVLTYSNELLGVNPGFLAWLLPALLILVIGVIHLARFVRNHPVPQIPSPELNDEAH